MEDRESCRECGEPRAADAHGELCPACLLQLGSAGRTPSEVGRGRHDALETIAVGPSPSSPAATPEPGAPARRAEALADVPRVHLRDDELSSESGPVVRPSSAEVP